MIEFKVIQELKPNTEILEIIKNYTYITKNGKVKHLLKTNLQFVEPTEYIITYPTTHRDIQPYIYKSTKINAFKSRFSIHYMDNPKYIMLYIETKKGLD